MPYGTDADPYLDPKTGILINSLGISSAEELERAEADITAAMITALPERPVPGNFNLGHLKDLHWELFGQIYPWAGQLRTVEIAKGETRFANSEVLERAANELFTKLREESFLNDLPQSDYADRLAHYYSEVNILHPFREGNGRTQRAFFTLLAINSGKRIAWERMNPEDNLTASIAAYKGNEGELAVMLSRLVQSPTSKA